MNKREEQKIKEKANKKAEENWIEFPKMIIRFNGKEYDPVLDNEEEQNESKRT